MPNWVRNVLTGVTPEIAKKYINEDGEFDFNTIRKLPDELLDVPSPTIKGALEMAEYLDSVDRGDEYPDHAYDIVHMVDEEYDSTCRMIGDIVLSEHQEVLDAVLADPKHEYAKKRVDKINAIYNGVPMRVRLENDQQKTLISNYISLKEKDFEEQKERFKGRNSIASLDRFASFRDYGRTLSEYKKNYGADNWYDWSIKNWGVKWNASDSVYDDQTESLEFNTPWSIPRPIISAIAAQNPDTKMHLCSDEETGWYEDATLSNGDVTVTESGEYLCPEDPENQVEGEWAPHPNEADRIYSNYAYQLVKLLTNGDE